MLPKAQPAHGRVAEEGEWRGRSHEEEDGDWRPLNDSTRAKVAVHRVSRLKARAAHHVACHHVHVVAGDPRQLR